MAALAGLLVVVGSNLLKAEHLRTARAHGELTVYVVTAAGVVAFGLLEGVVAGVVLSLVLMARRVMRAQVRLERVDQGNLEDQEDQDERTTVAAHWRVVAEGTLSFLSVPRLSRLLAEIPAGSVVALHLVVDFLDHAVADHLHTWKHQHEAGGGIVLVDDLALVPRSIR